MSRAERGEAAGRGHRTNHPGRWSALTRESVRAHEGGGGGREGGRDDEGVEQSRVEDIGVPAAPCPSPQRKRERENAIGKSLLHQPRLQGASRVRQHDSDVTGFVHPNYEEQIFLFNCGSSQARQFSFLPFQV